MDDAIANVTFALQDRGMSGGISAAERIPMKDGM